MDYQYDIFISYRNEFPINQWVFDYFLPFLKPYVRNHIDKEINIFIDRSRIQGGDSWPQRLKSALARSRCLVPIWSPTYFRSKWCTRECAVMRNRENKLGFRTIQNPSGLIIPVKVFDGELFPQYAKDIQCFDCRDYLRIGEGYQKSETYVEFQGKLMNWSSDVVQALLQAPPWSEKWLSTEWLEDTFRDEIILDEPRFIPPRFD